MKKKETKTASKTKANKEKLLEALGACRGVILRACNKAGVGRKTYYNWMETDEAFRSEVALIQDEQIDFVEGNLLNLIESGDTTATIFYLKTRGKHRGYSERIELTGKDGRDLYAKMSEAELRELIERTTGEL